jgi:hypothetical protein
MHLCIFALSGSMMKASVNAHTEKNYSSIGFKHYYDKNLNCDNDPFFNIVKAASLPNE